MIEYLFIHDLKERIAKVDHPLKGNYRDVQKVARCFIFKMKSLLCFQIFQEAYRTFSTKFKPWQLSIADCNICSKLRLVFHMISSLDQTFLAKVTFEENMHESLSCILYKLNQCPEMQKISMFYHP